MNSSTKKTTFKTVLVWLGSAVAAALFIVPLVLVVRSARALEAEHAKGKAVLEQGKAELARIEALDRVRSEKIEAAKTLKPGAARCVEAPQVAVPPSSQGSDLDGQFWRHYMDELRSSQSPFELRGPTSLIGATDAPGGPRLRNLRTAVSDIDRFVGSGSVREALPKLPSAKDWLRDVTIVVDEVENPHMLPGSREFHAGYTSGMAFLFDYERGDIVCVGRFHATSGDSFEANMRKVGGMEVTTDIHYDLAARIIVAGVLSLRAVQ